MNKIKVNIPIPKKEAKNNKEAVLCDSCDRYFYRYFIHKWKGGNYCCGCNELNISVQSVKGQLSDEEVQKMIKEMLKTSLQDEDDKKKK